MNSALRRDLLEKLRKILPPESVLADEEGMRPFECDGLTVYCELPGIVVLPENASQVQAVLQLCHARQVPVVARGAGTGLSGGAMPHREGVLLVLSKLSRILSIDAQAGTVVVQPGVRNLAVSEAVAAHGLYYAPDPSSQIACTIGGNVAENAGGVHCLKYGLTVHNVLQARGFTVAGEEVVFGSQAPDVPGYDMLALLTGSEGMLAVLTEITLKLTPKPQFAQVLLASFDVIEQAAEAVASIIAGGIIPAGLEMMDRKAIHAVEPYARAGYDMEAEAVLLCESDGSPEEVAEEIGRMKAVLSASGARRIRVSQSEDERLLFWAGRKSAFSAIGRLTPDYLCMDGTIPRRNLAQMLASIAQMEIKYGLRCANVFHAGDGNLHPLIMFDARIPDEMERAKAFGSEILEMSVALGGSITGEHGVGVEKLAQMCAQFSADELEVFRGVKQVFDEHALLNPGKVIPTLARCREYREAR